MADNSLSPNRATQRLLKYRAAVMKIARYRAKRAVQAQIRAKGLKIAQFTAREISLLAEAELERNREELITKAAADVASFPEFARYRAELDVASVWKVSRNRTLPQPQTTECSENCR